MDSIPERLAVAGSPCTLFHRTTSYPLLKIIVNDKRNRQNDCMKTIPLSRGLVATVSDRDYRRVNQYKWCATKNSRNHTWYAHRADRSSGRVRKIRLHRFILGAPRGLEVDHKDRDGLNNTRANLRLATGSQNKMNMNGWSKNGFKGVTLMPKRGRLPWRARIQCNKKVIHIGYYTSIKEAALAYNRAAKKYFGKFARLNVVP